MNIIIEIYIFVCIALLLFDIAFLVTKNYKNKKLYTRNDKLRDQIQSELENYNTEMGLSVELKSFLDKDIEKTKKLIILQNALENITINEEEIKEEIRPYVLAKIECYKDKTDLEQAYYSYMVSVFDYQADEDYSEEFYLKFFAFLDSKSLYVFANTMDSIYKFHDPFLINMAIKKSDERSGFYHSKLLIDGLLKFEGDTRILQSEIIKEFYNYTPLTQESLLTYFRLNNAKISEFCIEILKEAKLDDEVLYAAMRYLERYPNDESKTIFIEVLENEESFWVEQLYAIKALKGYNAPLVKRVIKEKITSPNWHVRITAIGYLHKHILSKEEIADILSIGDKYTNETLLYYYKEDAELTEYIIDTIQILKEEKDIRINGQAAVAVS